MALGIYLIGYWRLPYVLDESDIVLKITDCDATIVPFVRRLIKLRPKAIELEKSADAASLIRANDKEHELVLCWLSRRQNEHHRLRQGIT